jgi:hypothetical protein
MGKHIRKKRLQAVKPSRKGSSGPKSKRKVQYRPGGFMVMSRAEFQKRLGKQRAGEKTARLNRLKRKAAVAARNKFKPRQGDRGKFVFVDTKGKANPQKKGRKGYAVYVTTTGKKWLQLEHKAKEPARARTRSKLLLPAGARLRKAKQKFTAARLVKVGQGKEERPLRKGFGTVNTGGTHDFNAGAVKRLAGQLRKYISNQASNRVYVVRFNALVKLPDGSTQAISGDVPIEYPDHAAISAIGVSAWVRHKFYAFMARELAYAGYVSAGSANHIRSLAVNQGKRRSQWKDSRGEPWAGRGKQQVEIQRIDWELEQAK